MHAAPASSPRPQGSDPPPPHLDHASTEDYTQRCWWSIPEFSIALGLRRPKDTDPNRAARDMLVRCKVLRRRPGGLRLWVVTVSGIKKMFPDDWPEVLAKLRAFDFARHQRLLRRRAR